MIKLLLLKLVWVIVFIFALSSASVQTENLRQLNLQPGFAIRLYTSSLRGPDDYHRRPQYFRERDFLEDSQLIAQNVLDMDINAGWSAYGNNLLFDFSVDPTITDFVVEMRGYIKAPLTGNISISTDIQSGFSCNGEGARTYQAGYWIIKDSISLNETSDGFICSYNSSDVNYKALIFEENCTDYDSCYNGDPTFNTVTTVTEGQYYPVVFYTYISANNLVTVWTLQFDGYFQGYFQDFAYYDPNDDFEADDARLNSGFPDACPHFHEEVFTATSFVTMSRTDDYDCPTPTSSSILPPSSSSSILPPSSSSILPPFSSSTLPSSKHSAIQPSSSGSSNSVSPSSSEPDSVVTPGSITPSSGSKISSAEPSSSTSSITGTSSMSKFQSSRSGTSKPSDLESESESVSSSSRNLKTSSNSESVTSSSSDSGLKFSLSSTVGTPMYTANSTVSHSEYNIPTSESTAMASSSSFSSETADGNATLSTATITESEIDTLTTTTCPETEQPQNTGEINPSLTSCEETFFASQESLSNEVTRITVGPEGVTATYTECAGCSALQENSFGVSGENSKLSTDTVDNAAPAHSTDMVTVNESALVFGEPALYSSHSTAVAVQALPGEGQFLTYEPLLLGLSILITFL